MLQIAAFIDAEEKSKRQRGIRAGGEHAPGEAAALVPNFGNSDPELVDEVLSLKKQVEQLMAMVKAGSGKASV